MGDFEPMGGTTERALVEEAPVATADFVERAFEPERALTPLDVDESHDRRAAPLPARRLVVVELLVVDVVALVVDDVDVLVDDVRRVLGLLLCVLPPLVILRRARTGRRPRPLPARLAGRLPRGLPRRVHAAPGMRKLPTSHRPSGKSYRYHELLHSKIMLTNL